MKKGIPPKTSLFFNETKRPTRNRSGKQKQEQQAMTEAETKSDPQKREDKGTKEG